MSKFTVAQCVDLGEQQFLQHDLFYGHGTNNAADEALWLVFYALGLSWDVDDTVMEQAVSDEDRNRIQSLFERRIKERVPAAYIAGEGWFCGLPFIVNEHVLVPRSPLAELIEQGLSPWLDHTNHPKILDLCTGSGCIGIASSLALPEAEVILSDISTEALDVAEQNIQKHGVENRVRAIESDLFKNIDQTFDLIISNPPYVDAEDFNSRPDEFKAEPDIALESGSDGLDFTRRLLKEAAHYLNDEGYLIVELGNSYRHLQALYPEIPFITLEFEHGGHGAFAIDKFSLQCAFAESA